MELPPGLLAFADVIMDPFVVIDRECNIVEFNTAFRGIVGVEAERGGLKNKKCHEVLQLESCADQCVAKKCWETGKIARLEEAAPQEGDTHPASRYRVRAVPLQDSGGEMMGALMVLRDTSEQHAEVQQKLENQARERQRLEELLEQRSKRIMELSRRLCQAQEALLKAKTELFG